jgi:hypothetical protein
MCQAAVSRCCRHDAVSTSRFACPLAWGPDPSPGQNQLGRITGHSPLDKGNMLPAARPQLWIISNTSMLSACQ